MKFEAQNWLLDFANYIKMFITHSLSIILVKNILIKTILQKYYNEDFEMICADSLKYCYYPLLADIIVDDQKQVFIIGIKANLQCFVCHVFP